jgi:hypothetical protein
MCKNIVENKRMGIYDGAYKVVEAAFDLKEGRRTLQEYQELI